MAKKQKTIEEQVQEKPWTSLEEVMEKINNGV